MSDNGDADYGEVFDENVFEEEDDNQHVAESLSQAMDELQSDDNIEMFSDLSMREIKLISPLLTTKDKTSSQLVYWYLKTNVSYRRKGRNEVIEAMKSIGGLNRQEEEKSRFQSLKERIV